MFANPTPITTEIPDKIIVSTSVRTPSRPTFRMSPISATPSTSAAKTSGTTTIKMSRKNI
jgi:hypothetical protein